MKPTPGKRIGDPGFRYTNSASTDIRKTFNRIRREMQKAAPPVTDPPSANPDEQTAGRQVGAGQVGGSTFHIPAYGPPEAAILPLHRKGGTK